MGNESHSSLQSLSVFNRSGFPGSRKNVKVEIQSYMFDRKAADLYLGLGGTYCDLCTLSKDECADVGIVKAWFIINQEVDTLVKIFEDPKQEDSTILKRRNDYDLSTGCHKSTFTLTDALVETLLQCRDQATQLNGIRQHNQWRPCIFRLGEPALKWRPFIPNIVVKFWK